MFGLNVMSPQVSVWSFGTLLQGFKIHLKVVKDQIWELNVIKWSGKADLAYFILLVDSFKIVHDH